MTNKNRLSDEKLDEVSGGANVKIGGQDDTIGYLSRVCPNCGSKFVRLYMYDDNGKIASAKKCNDCGTVFDREEPVILQDELNRLK